MAADFTVVGLYARICYVVYDHRVVDGYARNALA
jgi:hypothetical protein